MKMSKRKLKALGLYSRISWAENSITGEEMSFYRVMCVLKTRSFSLSTDYAVLNLF
jgi:hypothetical protein